MKYTQIFFLLCTVLLYTLVSASDEGKVSFDSHDLQISIDVHSQSATIVDNGQLTIQTGWNYFLVNRTTIVKALVINNKNIKFELVNKIDSANAHLYQTEPENENEYNPKSKFLFFKSDEAGSFPFRITYAATYKDPVENVRFSNENVGREVAGTILEKGAYLSGSAYFYPRGKEEVASFSVTADIPAEWESVSDGNKMKQTIDGDRKIQSWENPYKSDGLMFMAAPYVIKDTTVNDINIACYFFEEDTSLFDGYLSATVGYMDMYADMIGKYPYNSFIVAENFFPTGYGMPGWTLLGQQVIRLPFIKFTSLGHEVLHNWWGNSVYVDYERGNWCEAAAVYGADYRYKLMRSENDAKSYRKDILKQYVSYVNEGNDFPIREFTSRTSPGTRTIGYNKAMMVYHMIEEEIGSDSFWQTWKNIYTNYVTKKISWEEWIDEFQKASDKDLSYIIPQWIDVAGAPELALSDVITSEESGNKRVTFKLSENSGQTYNLLVPVRFTGKDETFDTTVSLANNEQIYQLTAPATAEKIEIDPDYHLFRKLYPEEVEPIISAVMGNEKRVYATDIADSLARDFFQQFSGNIEENPQPLMPYATLTEGVKGHSLFALNPSELPGYLSDKIKVANGTLMVEGAVFPLEGHTFILSGDKLGIYEKYIVIITQDFASLPRLGQLIPHYGKYSYLVFQGARNIAKGQWDITSSPLKTGL